MSSTDRCPNCHHYRGNHKPDCIIFSCECAGFVDLSDPAVNTPGPRHRGAVATEATAGDLIQPRSGTLRMAALRLIAERYPDGLTDTELAEEAGRYRYTMAPRRVELMRGGWVRDSGRRRRTGHDRDEVVWAVTEAGHQQWEERQ